MASELPIVTALRDDNSDAVYTERHKAADLITELTEALREARRLICSGEQSDAVYHVHVARAAAIIDEAIAKAEGQINE